MTIVVTITVAALTAQSVNKFSAYILQNIEETSTVMAERSAAEIAGIVENWIAQISVTTSKLSGSKVDANNNDTDLAAVLRADKDLLALNLYSVDGESVKLIRQARQDKLVYRGRGTAPNETFIDRCVEAMSGFASSAAKNESIFEDAIAIRNITPQTKSPAMLLAVKFSIPNQPNKFAVMIAVTQMTKLQVALPQSRYTSSYIISRDGSIFSSTDETQMMIKKPIAQNDLVKKALKRQAPSGFLPEFADKSGKQKIGSFAQTPGRISLFVIVERDRKAAFRVITRTYASSALWGVLFLLIAAMISYFTAGTVTKNLRDLVGATRRIANGEFAYRLQPYSRDEVAELGHSVNNMAARIQMLMKSEIEKVRFEKELETAKMVQSTFFPKKDVSSSHLTVTGNYQPATECGGDLWGHYSIKDGVELLFIADAMGHGVPAALVTAVAYAVCQSVANILQEKSTIDASPAALLKRLNNVILDAVDGKISMTFFAAVFDFNSGQLTYANAGHNFPFIITANKDDSRLGKATKKSEKAPTASITLTLQGTPLGVEKDGEYKEKQINLLPGDKIFFFTDGLIENHLTNTQPLGRKGLLESVCMFGNLDIAQIKDRTLAAGVEIYGSDNLQDDVTIVVAEISKTWQKSGSSGQNVFVPPPPSPQAKAEPETQAPLDLPAAPIPVFEIAELAATPSRAPTELPSLANFDLNEGLICESNERSDQETTEKPLRKIQLPAV